MPLLIVSALLMFSFLADKTDWKLEKEKDGIQVYTRLKEGYKIKEFKAVTTVEASLTSTVALVKDATAAPDWYSHVRSGESLEVFDERRSIVRLQLDFPFPANDRDLIAKFDYSQDPDTKVVTSKVVGVPDYLPPEDGLIRVPELAGSWTFTPISKSEVKIEYQFYTDPGGNLPAWVINMFIVDDPFKSLRKLKDLVKEDKYRNAVIGFIVE